MYKIYLDDVRTPVDPTWVVVRSYDEFVSKVQEIGFEPLFHLDDDFVELNGINRNLKTVKAISCIGGGWKKKIEKIVGNLK